METIAVISDVPRSLAPLPDTKATVAARYRGVDIASWAEFRSDEGVSSVGVLSRRGSGQHNGNYKEHRRKHGELPHARTA